MQTTIIKLNLEIQTATSSSGTARRGNRSCVQDDHAQCVITTPDELLWRQSYAAPPLLCSDVLQQEEQYLRSITPTRRHRATQTQGRMDRISPDSSVGRRTNLRTRGQTSSASVCTNAARQLSGDHYGLTSHSDAPPSRGDDASPASAPDNQLHRSRNEHSLCFALITLAMDKPCPARSTPMDNAVYAQTTKRSTMHHESALLSSDASTTILHAGKKYVSLPKTRSKRPARSYLKRASNFALGSAAARLCSRTTRAQSKHAPTNAIIAHDAARQAAFGTPTALVDQLVFPTSDSPKHRQDTPRHTGAPTSEPQVLNSREINKRTSHDYTIATDCRRRSYHLTTEECPRTKDLSDLLHQWWYDSDSYANSDDSTQAGVHTEYYDLCSAHDAQGVLPSSNYASSHHQALLPAVGCHYDCVQFPTQRTNYADHQPQSSHAEITLDGDITTSEIHFACADAASADDFCVDALPHTSRSDKQSQTLRTSSGLPRGRTIVAEHLATQTRPLANKHEQHELPRRTYLHCSSTDAVRGMHQLLAA